ncbi:hypothetical protein APX70_03653, partial [Pseudomonas syringae pv. maculicola]
QGRELLSEADQRRAVQQAAAQYATQPAKPCDIDLQDHQATLLQRGNGSVLIPGLQCAVLRCALGVQRAILE